MNVNWQAARPGYIPSTAAHPDARIKYDARDPVADNSKDMTPARDQGRHNKTCTAFALTALLEHQYKLEHKRDIELSAPWLHFCVSGRAETQFFDLALLAQEIARRQVFMPTVAQAGRGPVYACGLVGEYRVPKIVSVNGEDAFKAHLATHGPVAATIHVEENFFDPWPGKQVYTSIERPPETHAVCVTGYNDLTGRWRVKNSFGPKWSEEDGYVDILYGHCSVTKYMAFGIQRPGVVAGGVTR